MAHLVEYCLDISGSQECRITLGEISDEDYRRELVCFDIRLSRECYSVTFASS
jgi:hypothetical protein